MSTNRLCIQLNKVVMLIYSNLGCRWKFALWNSLPLKKQQFPAHRKSECHKQRLGSIFSRWFTSFILAATVWRWTFQTCDPRYLSAARNRTGEMGRLRTLFVRLIATMADLCIVNMQDISKWLCAQSYGMSPTGKGRKATPLAKRQGQKAYRYVGFTAFLKLTSRNK